MLAVLFFPVCEMFQKALRQFIFFTDLYKVYELDIHPSTGDVYFTGNYSDIYMGLVGVFNSSNGEITVIYEQPNRECRDVVVDYKHQ